jgi:integrase
MTNTDDDRNRFTLTNASIKAKCLPPEPGELTARGNVRLERFYWDDKLGGFGIVVRASSRSFIVQKDVRGRSVRVTIGGFPEWTAVRARKEARERIVEMDKGGNPNVRKRAEAVRGVTLAQAMTWHFEAGGCSERTIADMEYEMTRHLFDWFKRPLVEITRNDCATRHRRITQNSGPYEANRVLRYFRACYNTADSQMDTDLPKCPVAKLAFNRENRRQEPIPWSRLPLWAQAVDSIANPVRRDLQFFVLFTGLRREDACTVRWEHINLTDEPILLGMVEVPPGCIHRPKPKGGEERAFTVPLSGYALELLRRRRIDNAKLYPDDGGWAFPTHNMRGEVTCVQEMKEKPIEPFGKLPSPHRLRDTFATAAHEANVTELDLKLLMNHMLPRSGSVTQRYIRPSVEHLSACVERVAEFLSAKLKPTATRLRAVPRAEVG